MSSSSDERLSSPEKVSVSSPPDIYASSEKEEESKSSSQPDDEEHSETGQEGTSNEDIDVDNSPNSADEAVNLVRPDEEYFRPIKRLRMVNVRPRLPPSPPKPLTPFFIKDILSHNTSAACGLNLSTERNNIVRPWDIGSSAVNLAAAAAAAASARRRPRSAEDDSQSAKSESESSSSPAVMPVNSSPLDALFEMTSKAFEGLDADEKASDPTRDHLNLFSNRQQPKKKRKSRTAFTNHQIFELEKRFLYQKYLSPADRDEIAQSLGLTNAQVITWFQNRRAKLKRDMEELKKDVDASDRLGISHRSILSSLHEMSNNKQKNSKSQES